MNEIERSLRTPDGTAISYRVLRNVVRRRVVALIHGMASNMTRWSEFVETTALIDAWDVLRIDLRGHAGSLFRGRVNMEVWCDDLAAVLDAEGYERVVIVGHCLGANLAAFFASRYPVRTSGLVLVEPMPREALTGTLKKLQPVRPLFSGVIAAVLLMNNLGLYRRRLPSLDLRQLDIRTRADMSREGSDRAMVKRYAVRWHDLRYLPSAVYFQEFLEVSRSLPPLKDVEAPVLALLSTGRFLSDPDVTQRVLAEFRDCKTVRLDARHWIPTERPVEMRLEIEKWCRAL